MVDNIQIAPDVTKVIEVKDTSAPLRTLLIKLTNQLRVLEQRIEALENGN